MNDEKSSCLCLDCEALTAKIAALEAELRTATGTDGLTGLASKARMYENLNQLFAILSRESTNLGGRRANNFSVIFADLNSFKKVNDGNHIRGDRILVEFARYLKKITREVDTVARFGGDEFVILAPGTDIKQAKTLCRKINHGLEFYLFDSSYEPLKISCSLGAASTSEGIVDKFGIVEIADARMQKKKQRH